MDGNYLQWPHNALLALGLPSSGEVGSAGQTCAGGRWLRGHCWGGVNACGAWISRQGVDIHAELSSGGDVGTPALDVKGIDWEK